MTQNIIQREKDKCKDMVEQQVASHSGYLFTNDPDYLTEHGSMEPMYKAAAKPQPPPPQPPPEPGMMDRAETAGEVQRRLHHGDPETLGLLLPRADPERP